MRLSVSCAASSFGADVRDFEFAVRDGVIKLDADGTMNVLVAQALARFHSEEFSFLFGEEARFTASELVFIQTEDFDTSRLVPAASTFLGEESLGVVPGGRAFFQTPDTSLIPHMKGALGDTVTQKAILVRSVDTSLGQALADAYMLGDARVQEAARERALYAIA